MISTPTVLVLGAGASHPYGFPLGAALADTIRSNLHQPGTFYFKQLQSLCELQDNPSPGDFYEENLRRFVAHFHGSDRLSIDRFILHNEQYAAVGKAAIAQVLLECEKRSRLLNVEDDHWYQYLNEHLDDAFDKLHTNKLSVITFNYDRSLETYLYHTWCNTHPRHESEIANLVTRIPILHVHGHLGQLDWQAPSLNPRRYGTDFDSDDLLRASLHIRTIHEAQAQTFARARHMMSAAARIIFLGFAYDATNLTNLDASSIGKKELLTGSAYQRTARELTAISTTFLQWMEFGRPEHRSLDFLRHTVALNA